MPIAQPAKIPVKASSADSMVWRGGGGNEGDENLMGCARGDFYHIHLYSIPTALHCTQAHNEISAQVGWQ